MTPHEAARSIEQEPYDPQAPADRAVYLKFTDDIDGLSALAETAAVAVRMQGCPWAAEKSERLVFAAARWILLNGHPKDTWLGVGVTCEERSITINVDDPGEKIPGDYGIPELPTGEWAGGAGTRLLDVLPLRTVDGRRIRLRFPIRLPYGVKYIWPAGIRPNETFSYYLTPEDMEAAARQCAERVEQERLVGFQVQGPDDADEVWREWEPNDVG